MKPECKGFAIERREVVMKSGRRGNVQVDYLKASILGLTHFVLRIALSIDVTARSQKIAISEGNM